jgi:hypothetical protein
MSDDDHLDEHDRRVARVKKAVADDPSGFSVVILAMAYAEYYLRRLIESKMDAPQALFTDRPNEHIDFSILVRIAESLGLIVAPFAKYLREFGYLRNKYAHQIDYEVTDEDLHKVWKFKQGMYDEDMRDLVKRLFNRFIANKKALFGLLVSDMLDTLDGEFSRRLDHARLERLKERQFAAFTDLFRDEGAPIVANRETFEQLFGSQYKPLT